MCDLFFYLVLLVIVQFLFYSVHMCDCHVVNGYLFTYLLIYVL